MSTTRGMAHDLLNSLASLFNTDGFMPHGYCYTWQPGLLWSMVVSEGLVALAYFSIPVALLFFLRRQPNIRYRGVFLLFSAFIFFCALTHVIGIVNIWIPLYRMEVALMVMTAAVSIATALMLWPLLPQASNFLSEQAAMKEQMREANARLQQALNELAERNVALDRRRRESEELSRLEIVMQSCLTLGETRLPVRSSAQSLFPSASGALYLINLMRRATTWSASVIGAPPTWGAASLAWRTAGPCARGVGPCCIWRMRTPSAAAISMQTCIADNRGASP